MVRFAEHDEAVPINTLAAKYLQMISELKISSATLEKRLDYYFLWRSIAFLYERSDKELEKTWAYKHLFLTLDYKLYWGWHDVEVRIRGRSFSTKMDNLLAFTAETCLELWPDHPEAKDWKIAQKKNNRHTTNGRP